MGDSAPHLQELLATLHDADAGPRERLRLHRIQALAARMSRLEGRARAVLDSRLQLLLRDASPPKQAGGLPPPTSAATAIGLAGLTHLLGELRARRAAGPASPTRQAPAPDSAREEISPASGVDPAPLPALEAARQTWARLRMDDHLRHVMAEVPDDAGPMHSTVLVHRAIAVMHEAAPGYLQHFLGYADALAALDRHCPAPVAAPPARAPRPRPPGPGTAKARATPRSRPRGKRRPA